MYVAPFFFTLFYFLIHPREEQLKTEVLIFGRRNDATKKLLANLVNQFLSVQLVKMRGKHWRGHSFLLGEGCDAAQRFFSFLLTYPSMCQFVSLFVFVFIFDPSPCRFIPSSHWSSGRLKITHLQPSWPLLRPGPARRQAGGGELSSCQF